MNSSKHNLRKMHRDYGKLYNKLVLNGLAGNQYKIKLANDSRLYRAIPVIEEGYQREHEGTVTMFILNPKDQKGIRNIHLEQIELLSDA